MENIRKLSPSISIIEGEKIEKKLATYSKTKLSVKQNLMKTLLVAGIFMIFIMFSSSAFALDARLNITFEELVYRNASFAKNFTLVEKTDSCNIEGNLSILNPGDETVDGIYIKLDDIDFLTTDFYYVSGKPGRQVSGGAGVEAEYINIDSTPNSVGMGLQDLDDDGFEDYVSVNSTYFRFNLSSQSEIIGVRLENSSGLIDISAVGAGIPIEMTEEPIVNGTGFVFGNVSVNGVVTANDDLAANVVLVNERVIGPIYIFIPQLRPTNSTIFSYNMSCIKNDPPINVSTTYESIHNPGIDRKVLAGQNWTITQNLTTYNPAGEDVTNLRVELKARNVSWNGTEYNFSLGYLFPEGDHIDVSGNGTSKSNWTWIPNGGTLAFGGNSYIKYSMYAPYNVPYSATYLALEEKFIYSINTLLSGINLSEVNASGKLDFGFTKRIIKPSDNEFSKNVTWEVVPSINNSLNISYEIHKVTVWVSETQDPSNDTASTGWGLLEKNFTGAPLAELNITDGWGVGQSWQFNYTDGSSASAPPPIVWIDPDWIIKNDYGQILNYSSASSGGDYYLKYIYVVNGYWLQIHKNVTSIDENKYQIDIIVENIGNGWTPENEVVTVYDFIPNEFVSADFTIVDSSNQSVGNPGSSYYGTALEWNIPWKDGKNSSLGPKNGFYSVAPANYSWTLSYNVTGVGEYKATELYIVGLDPFKVDGANVSPIITIIASFQNYSNEIMYSAVVLFLIVINVANFVMTHNINKKIGNRLPPVPKKKR